MDRSLQSVSEDLVEGTLLKGACTHELSLLPLFKMLINESSHTKNKSRLAYSEGTAGRWEWGRETVDIRVGKK